MTPADWLARAIAHYDDLSAAQPEEDPGAWHLTDLALIAAAIAKVPAEVHAELEARERKAAKHQRFMADLMRDSGAEQPTTVYIAGPMTGLPELNYPAFNAAADALSAKGYRVVNPADHHDHETERSWEWYMRKALAELVECDAVALLPEWHNSRGARIEHDIADKLGMRVAPLADYLDAGGNPSTDAETIAALRAKLTGDADPFGDDRDEWIGQVQG